MKGREKKNLVASLCRQSSLLQLLWASVPIPPMSQCYDGRDKKCGNVAGLLRK